MNRVPWHADRRCATRGQPYRAAEAAVYDNRKPRKPREADRSLRGLGTDDRAPSIHRGRAAARWEIQDERTLAGVPGNGRAAGGIGLGAG
jgi:hypothetical protein